MNACVQAAVLRAGFAPAPGLTVTGYCTRKGAATAAHSVNVPLTLIRYWGGWAAGSDVVMRYIDVAAPATAAARLFFEYLCASSDAARSPPSLVAWLGTLDPAALRAVLPLSLPREFFASDAAAVAVAAPVLSGAAGI